MLIIFFILFVFFFKRRNFKKKKSNMLEVNNICIHLDRGLLTCSKCFFGKTNY